MHTYIYSCYKATKLYIHVVYFKQHYSLKTKPSVSQNGLGQPQNDLGGCQDQAYHFQHQKLPLYARSREPFRTNMQTNKFLCFISIDNNTGQLYSIYTVNNTGQLYSIYTVNNTGQLYSIYTVNNTGQLYSIYTVNNTGQLYSIYTVNNTGQLYSIYTVNNTGQLYSY